MGPEKKVNSVADYQNTWLQEGKSEWHHQVGDFWGPIMANLRAGGGWLTIKDEIFNTGSEHRFYSKEVAHEESWRRRPHNEQGEDDDPAQVLFETVLATYRGEEFPDLRRDQLVNGARIQAQIEGAHLAEERNRKMKSSKTVNLTRFWIWTPRRNRLRFELMLTIGMQSSQICGTTFQDV
jgi:hypothetical protein